jgi:hypothetical protein
MVELEDYFELKFDSPLWFIVSIGVFIGSSYPTFSSISQNLLILFVIFCIDD